MEKCKNTQYGLDTENGLQRVHVDEVVKRYREAPFYIQCEKCEGRLFPKCGEIRAHHFAHFYLRGAEKAPRPFTSSPSGGPSEWHKKWQSIFEKEYRERKDSSYHQEDGLRADVKFDDAKVVIEIQKGEFGIDGNKDTCQKRNVFWTDRGYDIIWLFADTKSKEENLSFDTKAQVVRIYRPYHDRLLGEELKITSHVEIHLEKNGMIYQLLPKRRNENDKMISYPYVLSYFNDFAPENQAIKPIPYGKERFLTAREEAKARYGWGDNNTPYDEELVIEEGPIPENVQKEINRMREKTKSKPATLDEIVKWANEINMGDREYLHTITVFSTDSGCIFKLYPKNQPKYGNMWGYLKRDRYGNVRNEWKEIYGRYNSEWNFLSW